MILTEALVESFISALLSEKGLSQNTAQSYLSDLKLFFSFVQKTPDCISCDDIRCYLAKYATNSGKTNNRRLSALRAFYKFLISENIVLTSPLNGLECAKTIKNIPRYLTEQEMVQLIGACDLLGADSNRIKLIVLMLYSTGMRVSELLSIRVRMIDFHENLINVIGKGGKERFLPVDKSVIEIIEKMAIKDYVFVSERTGAVVTRQRIFQIIQKLGKMIGVQGLSPHKIRHSYATHLLNNGANILNVQKLLGHCDVSTTEIYTHISDERLSETLDKCHPLNTN